MILNASQLEAIRQRNDEELRSGTRTSHGYPAATIRDLLQTVDALKKEKRKWKKLAQDRGQVLAAIQDMAGRTVHANADQNGSRGLVADERSGALGPAADD
ncbi:hypothetical protein Dde_3015 [Oleidesulfovibrio alaskensis G20]|jgi:hypothetical protein|uniref:Uncharacterized protein n=1 Tax=Oleidesulfovibrio alaskensis (strain ATCC BAA-1058 / DSM 17464 / G20) TaxID=207559 RepID=Q30WY7_OLEA2|nr:hypothetical protein [Oleidesulfovibrio alaskensis]ABB39809.1 hypothetical protein Dde_3015 [Oleidesulfovibrio alaskensis G20]